MFLDYILLLFIFINAVILSIQDIKSQCVNIIYLGIFCLSCLLWYLMHPFCNLTLFFIFLIIGISTKIFLKKEYIGIADYFVILFVSPFLYKISLSFVLILIGFFGIITSFFIRSKTISFILPILLSVLIVNIFKILY